MHGLVHHYRVKAHILTDKVLELIGGDLSQPFESGDLWVFELRYGIDTLFIGIAINSFLAIAHTE